MIDVEQTIISQYANSPILVQLIKDMNDAIDPAANIQAFYDTVWNVNTAKGFGLDIWGCIVGVGRSLSIPATVSYLGFNPYGETFNNGVFNNGQPVNTTYLLSDDQYRTLIFAKALANITQTNSLALNRLLQNLFPTQGRCYVLDLGTMTMIYRFEYEPSVVDKAIITQSGVLPHPAGVATWVVIGDAFKYVWRSTFGFSTFFNERTNMIRIA